MNQDQGNDNPASAPQVNVNNKSAARSYPGKGPSTTAAPGPQALGASSLIPVKRGPGRPKGSKNKEKAPITPNQLNIPSAKSGSKLTATTASKQSRDSGGQFAANPPISVAALEPKGFPQQPQQFKQNKVALKEPRNPPPTRASGVLNGPGLQPPRVPPASLPRPGSQLSHQLSSNPSAQLPTPHFVDISSKAGYDSDWVKEQVRLAIEQWLFIGREPPEAAIWAALNEARRNEDERLHPLNVENPQPSPWWTIARNYDENCLYLLQARLQNPQNHPGEYVTFDPKQVEAQRKKDPNWLIGIIGVRLVRKPERLQNNPEWVEQMVKDIRSAANRPVFDLPNHMINQSDYPAKQQALREAEAVVSVDVGASQNLPNAWSDRPNQDIWNFPDHLRYDIPPNVQGQILDNNSFKQYPDFQLPKAAMRPEDAVKELADAHRASRDSDVTKLREHLQQNLPPVLLRQVLSPPTPNPLRPIHLPSPDVLPFPDPRELAEAFTADQKEALLRLRQQLTNTLSPTELEEVLSSPGFHLPVPEPAKSSEPAKIKNNPQPGSWTSETDFHHFNAPFPYEDYDELDNQRQGGESLAAALYPSNPKEDDGHNGNGREPGNQDGTNIVNTITRDDGEITIGSIERDETITAIDSAIEQGRDDAELDNIFGDIMADIDRDEDYNEFISSVERPPDELGRPSEEALKSAKKAVPKSLVGVKRTSDSFQNQMLSKAEVVGDIVYFSGPPIPPPLPPPCLSRLSRLSPKPPHHAQKLRHLPRQPLSPSAMDSRIAASQNEDEVKLLGREYLYLRQLSRPPHDGLGQHQILRMNALITRLNKIDLTLVPWLNLDQADRRGTAPSQLALDIDYDPLSSNLTAEQEEREARRCMAAVRIIFPGLYQSLKTGEKYCGEGFVERYGCTIQQGEDVFNGFCSGKQADIIAEDNRMMLANIANNARLQSDRSYLQVEAARATVNEGLASKKQKLMEKNNTLTIDGNSALQQAAVDLSSSSQIIEHAASTSGQALLPVSNIIHLPESSTASALKQIRTPTLDAKVIPTILENSPQELQQKLAPAMSMASSSVIHDASVPQTASNTGETLIVPDKPVESPQRFFIKNSHTKNASASIGDPSGRSSKSAITSLKQPSSFSTSESSTAMDICEPESMMEISAAGSAMEISDEEGQINEDIACPQLTSPASLAQKNGNNIPKNHQNKEAFAAVQQQDHNINMEPRRRYYSKFEYPPDGPSAYSWGVARHWGARPPPGAYRPDNVVFTDGITASRSSLSTSPSRKTANDPPPSYSPTPPPAASHIIVAQQPNRIMPARVGGSSVPFDHRVEAAIQDPTLSSLPPVPANLPPRPANRATTPPQAARSLMRGPVDPDSPTPWRSPGGKLHRSGPPLSQSHPRPSPSRPSQQVGGLVPVDWNGSSRFEYVIMKLYSRNQRDEAATRLQRLIDDDLAYGLLKIVSLPNDKSIKVSGPQGFRTRDNLVRLFPEAKSFAHATN